jgi:NADPH:quinone reductase
MRAVVFSRPGGIEVVEVREVPEPKMGEHDLLVEVAYAGLNRADILEREGRYGAPPSSGPLIPGMEYSGTVRAFGSHVKGFEAGDRVFGLTAGGAQAERVAVDAGTGMRIPDALDLETAGAVPEAFVTAWDALSAGGFTLGHTVVVHAAGSSVALAAMALVKAGGGTTVGTSRTPVKLARAGEYGLDYGALLSDDWPAVAKRVTGGRGADLVLDFIGPATFERNVAALRPGGRIVQIGTLGGAKGEVSFGAFMGKRVHLIGTLLRSRALHEKTALARRFASEIVPLFARKSVRPVIDRVFPLDEIRDAQRHMESDANFGKILLSLRN